MSQTAPDPHMALDGQLCFSVYAAAHAFAQAYRPHLEPLGLTYPQYLVLLLLWEQDGQSVRQLGDRLFLDSGTLTPLLKRMEQGGWLSRSRDTKDERIVRVTLTAKGQQQREAAQVIPAAMLCSTGLDLAGLGALRDELRSVGSSLRKSAKADAKAGA